ncbi:MAG: helix-turn-helix domain-containing protein [Succinivibrionaceae bacterium]
MANEKVIEEAKALGEKYRSARENNNLTLNYISEKLEIRSYLLNDIEKGRFSYVKPGDCYAYAKYLGLDLNEVKRIREQVAAITVNKESDETSISIKKVVVGVVSVVILVMIIATIANSCGSNKEPKPLSIPIDDVKPTQNNIQIVEEKSTIIEPKIIEETVDNTENNVKESVEDNNTVSLPLENVEIDESLPLVEEPIILPEENKTVEEKSSTTQNTAIDEVHPVIEEKKEKTQVVDKKEVTKQKEEIKIKPEKTEKIIKKSTNTIKPNVGEKTVQTVKAGEIRPFNETVKTATKTTSKEQLKKEQPKKELKQKVKQEVKEVKKENKQETVTKSNDNIKIKVGEVRPFAEMGQSGTISTPSKVVKDKNTKLSEEELKKKVDQVKISEAVVANEL